jgi:hypothetical protein
MSSNIVVQGPNGERVRISPARDIAHFWGQLAAKAIDRIDAEEFWPSSLRKLAAEAGVTGGQVADAGMRMARALELATVSGPEIPVDALRLSGFLDCPPLAQAIVMVRLGQVSLGAWWNGIKDATVEGTVPACREDLIRTGVSLAASLNTEFSLLSTTPAGE